MSFIRKEMERIWKELPCLSPASRLHWKALVSKTGLWFWEPATYILKWRPSRIMEGWSSFWREPK